MEIKEKPKQFVKAFDATAADKQLREVAALYEKQFLREMVKQMRSTVSESELMPASFAEKYYREQLDQQYVESWGDQGGIGLGKLIYEQLMDRFGQRMGIRVPTATPKGPLPLSERNQWTGRVSGPRRTVEFERTPGSSGKPIGIESPWDGQWLGSFRLDNGLNVVKVQHDGVQTTFVGSFQFCDKKAGDVVRAGEQLGILAPDAKSFLWRLD